MKGKITLALLAAGAVSMMALGCNKEMETTTSTYRGHFYGNGRHYVVFDDKKLTKRGDHPDSIVADLTAEGNPTEFVIGQDYTVQSTRRNLWGPGKVVSAYSVSNK